MTHETLWHRFRAHWLPPQQSVDTTVAPCSARLVALAELHGIVELGQIAVTVRRMEDQLDALAAESAETEAAVQRLRNGGML